MNPGAVRRARSDCRRPIEPQEVPLLEDLGDKLGEARRQAGLSIRELARRSGMSPGHLCKVEAGARRTRRSVLRRLARALTEDLVGARTLEAEFVATGGAAIAPERLYDRNHRP